MDRIDQKILDLLKENADVRHDEPVQRARHALCVALALLGMLSARPALRRTTTGTS